MANVTVTSCKARSKQEKKIWKLLGFWEQCFIIFINQLENSTCPEIQIEHTIMTNKQHTLQIQTSFSMNQAIQHESSRNNNEQQNSFQHNFLITQPFLMM